ncbi:hypothetical protein PF008_g6845 [Phytophthora fragariae]|uniref:WW domain-containing protein n=1 Tax=Phytophthora fragariae TaxID=53985 RepID=A0A6G0S5U9_9STRA|nr:hypothetical protein PF008_g6845 [Phytophthora fragariae]
MDHQAEVAAMEAAGSSTQSTDVQTRVLDEESLADSNDVTTASEDAPGDNLWVRKWDDTSNSLFYFNLRTQESSWEQPQAYKAVFMSEPMEMDSERAQDVVEPAIDLQDEQLGLQQEQSNASVAIQSLYRGRKDRKRVKEARKWTEQFDPATAQKYFYNSETGESQWEKPADFLTGVKDERSVRAVKIQSVYRAKKARDRVKELADEEEEEEELMKQQVQDEAEADELAAAVADTSSPRAVWCEYFDPRSGKYYYRHVVTDDITWEKPEKYVSSWVEGSKRDLAALSIQCAARKRIATLGVEAKREKLRTLTDPATMQLKLGELKHVSVEIQAEIDTRALVSTEEEQQFPHLVNLLSGWRESLESIKNHITSLENQGEDIMLAECLASRVAHAERFHKALAEMRSECLTVLRSILLMNSYFVDLDVSRVNVACTTFAKWKMHEVCALRDSRLVESIQGSDISQVLDRAEALLRRAMGLTEFHNGSTSADGKRYEDWHPSVAAALVGVREMEERLTQKTQLLRGYRSAEVRKREISQMAEEDLLASRLAQLRRRRLNDDVGHATFLLKCQEYWKKGLNQREEDLHTATAFKSSKKQQQSKNQEVPLNESAGDSDNQDAKSKLSIWEATKEGLSVDVVRAMVFAEMQKARRLGYDFLVKSARSDHGETLIQIACWWGHAHLVRFFLEEGAQIDGIDNTCNRFSLLHDAARRGHSHVLRILLEHGLSCNVTDSTGDTPFHWAARRNNYSAVLTLLGGHSLDRDKSAADVIIKAIASIQETCLDKVLRWFEATEASAFTSSTASTPILPPRMSPKKLSTALNPALDKCASETSFHPVTTSVSSSTVAAKLEKYKMPDLRASHIRRIAELRSRGADVSETSLPIEEDNNVLDSNPQGSEDSRRQAVQDRMIEATFKLYRPETDAEREMNLLWIKRRQEDEVTRRKDVEVQQRVHKWSMDRSRDESENLRKRESTRMVAGLNQILQEGVDQDKPFAWRSSKHLHPDLAGLTSPSNQSAATSTKAGVATKESKEVVQRDSVVTRKQPMQALSSGKQPTQIIIKNTRPSMTSGGGMHFRNQLPPNYVPPGLLAASSVPKTKRETASAPLNVSSGNERSGARSSLEARASGTSDDPSSASEAEDEDPMTDNKIMRRQQSISLEPRQQMKLQSYHVPYYYSDSAAMAGVPKPQKAHPRGTIPSQPLPADPELRCLQEASARRQVFALPLDKALQKPAPPPVTIREVEREISSSRKSGRSESNKPRRGSKSAKGKKTPTSARTVPRAAAVYTLSVPPVTASTSDLRQSQLEELEKIRRLFEENHLSLSAQTLERGLLVPEDRPLLESITNLPFAGSRLLINPLTRRSKPAKAKKKLGAKKKKSKKGKKSAKGSKALKSSRRASPNKTK